MTGPAVTGLADTDLAALNALADGELTEPAASALLARIDTDPDLAKVYGQIQALRGTLARLEKPEVSTEFLSRLMGSAAGPHGPGQNRRIPWHFSALLGVGLASAAAASVATFFLMAPYIATPLTARLADLHRQSLLDASPVQIASSDRHTVKPWLDSKIGLSPPAPDLTAAGFVLLGGRIEVLNGAALPALAYRHNEHLITLLAIPATKGPNGIQSFAADGYNIQHWVAAGFEFWAISDLELGALHDFATAFQNALPAS